MKKKSKARSAGVRAMIAVAVLSASECLIPGGELFASFLTAKFSNRTLTFAERVMYQRAIEEVYWQHRIWPRGGGENSRPKPSLDAVVSRAGSEKKVRDYLCKSQALEDYWQRPITPEQLQAEMDRIAEHTQQPEYCANSSKRSATIRS